MEDKIFELQTLFVEKTEMLFSSLIDEDYTKLEVITLFMATLELLKRQEIRVKQDELYDEILLIRNDDDEKLTA